MRAFRVRTNVIVALSQWLDEAYQSAGLESPLNAEALAVYVQLQHNGVPESIVTHVIASTNEQQAENVQQLYRRNHMGFMQSRYGSAFTSEEQDEGTAANPSHSVFIALQTTLLSFIGANAADENATIGVHISEIEVGLEPTHDNIEIIRQLSEAVPAPPTGSGKFKVQMFGLLIILLNNNNCQFCRISCSPV